MLMTDRTPNQAMQPNHWPALIADSGSANGVNFSFTPHNETLSIVAMRVSDEDCSPSEDPTSERQPQLQPASGVVDHLRSRLAHFKLCPRLLGDLFRRIRQDDSQAASLARAEAWV
jgi:hypothetical protein